MHGMSVDLSGNSML